MKVCWFGYLGKNHSWSIVAQNLSRELIALGHEVDLFSTNGNSYFPVDLEPYLKGFITEEQLINSSEVQQQFFKLDATYDMQLSYTALRNFANYFRRGDTN